MDQLLISSKLFKTFIEKTLRKMIKKKTGLDIRIYIDEINVKNQDNRTVIHLNANASADTDALLTFIEKKLS